MSFHCHSSLRFHPFSFPLASAFTPGLNVAIDWVSLSTWTPELLSPLNIQCRHEELPEGSAKSPVNRAI